MTPLLATLKDDPTKVFRIITIIYRKFDGMVAVCEMMNDTVWTKKGDLVEYNIRVITTDVKTPEWENV